MTVPRVVVDTNVLVSGLLGGSGLDVIRRWRQGDFVLVISPQIFEEYESVLKRPKFGLPEWLVDELLLFIRERADWVEPKAQVEVARDPDDNKFLEAAIDGQVEYIVSGDNDLLTLETFEGIPIVPPWELAKEE
jgi:putative PIN family toxin of toxin-antitoxin system